jgi:hypothetical protein
MVEGRLDLYDRSARVRRGKAAPSDDTRKGRPVGAALFGRRPCLGESVAIAARWSRVTLRDKMGADVAVNPHCVVPLERGCGRCGRRACACCLPAAAAAAGLAPCHGTFASGGRGGLRHRAAVAGPVCTSPPGHQSGFHRPHGPMAWPPWPWLPLSPAVRLVSSLARSTSFRLAGICSLRVVPMPALVSRAWVAPLACPLAGRRSGPGRCPAFSSLSSPALRRGDRLMSAGLSAQPISPFQFLPTGRTWRL